MSKHVTKTKKQNTNNKTKDWVPPNYWLESNQSLTVDGAPLGGKKTKNSKKKKKNVWVTQTVTDIFLIFFCLCVCCFNFFCDILLSLTITVI